MNLWINVAHNATEVLSVVLIFRLLWLQDKQNGIYRTFVAFLLAQIFSTLGYYACYWWQQLDYRIVWSITTSIVAGFSLVLVYALAKAVLAELPGVLRISKIILKVVFPLAIIIAFSTSRSEYWLTPAKNRYGGIDRLFNAFLVADKGIAFASVLFLLIIFAFILWFPVKMSRNLAIFSIGLVVYFACKAGLELLTIYHLTSSHARSIYGVCINVTLALCFIYWIVFIDAKGRSAEVRIGHSWRSDEQKRLIEQMEALNGVLMRTSQRLPL